MHKKQRQLQNSQKQVEVHQTIDQQRQNHRLRATAAIATGAWLGGGLA